MCRKAIFVAGCLCLLPGLAQPAQAQLAQVNYKGKIVSFSPDGWIGVQLEDGSVILAGVSEERKEDGVVMGGIPKPKVEIIGEETIKFLERGMLVRFNAKVVAEKKIVDPIEEVTVFQQNENTVFGMSPNNLGPPAEGDAQAKSGEAREMLIAGRLLSIKGTTFAVDFPDGKSIRGKLSRDAVVKINSGDPRMARPGDLIEVTGLRVKPNKIFALEAKITRPSADPRKRVARGARNAQAPQADEAGGGGPGAGFNPDQNAKAAPPPAEAVGENKQPKAYRGKILIIN